MENLAWPDIAVYAMILISVSIFATQWVTYGFRGTCLQQPISNKTMTTMVIMFIVLIAYNQYLQTNNILPNRLYVVLCTLVIPTAWGIFCRYYILAPGMAEFNQANIILLSLIKEYYQPGQYNQDQERELSKSRLAVSAIKLYTKAVEQQKGKITTPYSTSTIDLDSHDDKSTIMVDCFQCSNYLSIDTHTCFFKTIICPICNHKIIMHSIDGKLFLFAEAIREITDQNLKNIAMTQTGMAILARMAGEITTSNELLVGAEKIIRFLLTKDSINNDDNEYNRILVSIIFQKAENEHIRNEYTKARVTYSECIELCKKTKQTSTLNMINKLLNKLS